MSSTPEASSILEHPLPLRPPGAAQTTRPFGEVGAVLPANFVLTVVLVSGTCVFHRVLPGKRQPRRGRRRRSRGGNPTLADAGALPNRRLDESSPPCPSP